MPEIQVIVPPTDRQGQTWEYLLIEWAEREGQIKDHAIIVIPSNQEMQ